MRLAVEQLPVHGRDIRFTEADAWARSAVALALEGEVLTVNGQIHLGRRKHRSGEAVAAVLHANATSRRTCDRCGSEVILDVTTDDELTYLPEGKALGDEEELTEQELDVGWYADGEIDVGQILSEALTLRLPVRVVCADQAACDEAFARRVPEPEPPTNGGGHPAFAALKKLL